MKTTILLFGLLANVSALEVHEWGTFTTLNSPQGYPLTWYQPASDLAGLPDFVDNGNLGGLLLSKSIPQALVRMETPVIYLVLRGF